ncbi:MAG TPA: tRNA-dihydrouridine synthase family protein [Verrucomicrobiae bacterium]|nr:tRNA-dihydrouridine synthase family protein [Verrucomicrobiae bacterium]
MRIRGPRGVATENALPQTLLAAEFSPGCFNATGCGYIIRVNFREEFDSWLSGQRPILALAPMQDVTDFPFWKLMARYGGADVYFTEYFRVHSTSNLEKHILKSITENPTGRPVIAQMIGNDIPSLTRSARELQQYPIAAVDLNLGCPAPVVYRKCAGGGLLREPDRVDSILGALRDAVKIKFTVKTRLGFDSPDVFEGLLPIFAKHSLDLLTVHGRTVHEMYRSEVHYDYIARAVEAVPCPVLANGNVYSAKKAEDVLKITGARGLMIGRGVIRNPWLFEQIRQSQSGATLFVPTGLDVLDYVRSLYEAVCSPDVSESAQVQKMKKYMNYLGVGVEPTGQFLHQIRRVTTKADFFRVCAEFLNHDCPMPLEPLPLTLKETDLMAGKQL